MAKKLNFNNAVLCDYVAAGGGNKHTLVNVYSGNIIFTADPPFALNVGFYCEFLPPVAGQFAVTFELRLDRKLYATFSAGGMSTGDTPAVIAIPMMEIGIDKDLTLEIVAKADGFATTPIIKKLVYKGEIPIITGA